MDIAGLIAHPERIALVAQPIVETKHGDIVGYELLSRFDFAARHAPDIVFAEAERQGLGAALNGVVVQKALELALHKPVNCFVTVNVEPRHLLSEELTSMFMHARSLGGIVIELTEHQALPDTRELCKSLDKLRERGAIIAVDDAGSGYSGLRQLLELRPQLVKLDRELVTGIDQDAAKLALIQTLGELVGRLDGWLLAEGIETANELRVLQQLGVPLVQGYFMARPAAPWSPLNVAARDALAAPAASSERFRALSHLLESCGVCDSDSTWPEEAIAVRVNAEGRPLALRFKYNAAFHVRPEPQIMRVKLSTRIAKVVERAVTRPEPLRWDPIVCIDDVGHLVGVVQMHRLIAMLAQMGDNQTASTSVRPDWS